MEHKILVRHGWEARVYMLTDRYYEHDPEECSIPSSPSILALMSPYTELFFHKCFDENNYARHLWDVLAKLGEVKFGCNVPEWFDRKNVVDRLAQLAIMGEIKIWELPNQRLRMIASEAVEVSGGGGSSSGSSSSSSKKSDGAKKAAAYNKKVEKEKAEKKSAGEKPAPISSSSYDTGKKNNLPPLPQSFEEIESRIATAAETVKKARKYDLPLPNSPYTTEDKFAIAQNGLEEKFIVRVIASKYAKDQGTIGWVNPQSQKSTYWTTTFTQLEYADSDAELIAKAVGTEYDPTSEYTLLIIDAEKAAETGDMQTFIPTYENMNEFAKRELANNPEVDSDYIDQVLTPEYSEKYADLWMQAKGEGLDLDDSEDLEGFSREQNLSAEERKSLKTRVAIHKTFGANEMFLGNGLTLDANAPKGQIEYGTVETFSYDKNPQTLGQLEEQKVLKRIKLDSAT